MAGITDANKEYATVERMRDMLNSIKAAEPYKVTLSYALFTSILCWSVQRLRSADPRAR